MQQVPLNFIFASGSPDPFPLEIQDRRYIHKTLDLSHLRLTILKAMRSGRKMDVGWIHGKIENDYAWLHSDVLFNALAALESDGLIIKTPHYYGSDCPSKDDYRGFNYIYSIPV